MNAPADAPIFDYDHWSAEYAQNRAEISRRMLEECPVAWSESHDGFWVISGYDDARFVVENWEAFSSENRGDPADRTRRGILIPQTPVPLMLNECDPPLHTKRRMIEAPYFTPRHLRGWVAAAEEYTRRALDRVIEQGSLEFVDDLCLRVPAMTTLHVGGVDPEAWELYARPDRVYGVDGEERARAEIMEDLVRLLERRRSDPRDDMASALAVAKIDGEPIDIRVAAGMLNTVVTGGFDTATSLLCNALDWLDRHHEQRAFLRAHPERMENAVEEFLRSFPPFGNLARNVVRDCELGGQRLRAGDRVLLSLHAANHDPRKFPAPFEMQLDRANAREHLSYSAGNHRCLGAPLARVELRHVLNEVLRRIPDFAIDRERARRFANLGVTDGWDLLPATFTPGCREG